MSDYFLLRDHGAENYTSCYSDEPKTHSNFEIQQGRNIYRISADKLSGFGSVAQYGNAVCISMCQAEVNTNGFSFRHTAQSR
jgi:hypothetical protein